MQAALHWGVVFLCFFLPSFRKVFKNRASKRKAKPDGEVQYGGRAHLHFTRQWTGYISAYSGASSGPSSGRLQTIPRILAEERHHAPYMIRLEDMFKHPAANTIAYVGYEPTPEYYLMPQVYGDGAQGL